MRALLPAVLSAGLLLTGCSDGPDSVATTTDAPPAVDLRIEVVTDAGAAPRSWTLTCSPAGGDHPDPEAACADLAAVQDPFAPVPEDALCTDVYGGPETALVRGTVDGRPVSLELSRTDGCRTEQWDRLGAVLPVSGGS